MTEPIRSIDWQPRADPTIERQRGFRDDPARIVLLIAVALLLAGAFLPWAQGRGPVGEPVEYTAQHDLAEGFILLILALILGVLAYGNTLVESRSRTVQLVPLVLVIVAAAMWLGADRTSLIHIESWLNGGGYGFQTAMPLVTAAGIALIVVGTIWLEFTRPGSVKAATNGLFAEWRISRVAMAEALIAGALGVIVAVVTGVGTIAILGGNGAIFAMFISLVGLAVGISAGLSIVRWLHGDAERKTTEAPASQPHVTLDRVERKR